MIKRWTTGRILPFPQIVDLGITKNNSGITPTFIAAKVFNGLPLNRIEPEILWKKKMVFGESDLQHHRFWQSVEWKKEFVQNTSRQHSFS